MAAVHGKWPGGTWTGASSVLWGTSETWLQIEELGAAGGKAGATVTGRINVRATATLSGTSSTSATGRLDVSGASAPAGSAGSTTTSGRLYQRLSAAMTGVAGFFAQGHSVNNQSGLGQHVELVTGQTDGVAIQIIRVTTDGLPVVSLRAS